MVSVNVRSAVLLFGFFLSNFLLSPIFLREEPFYFDITIYNKVHPIELVLNTKYQIPIPIQSNLIKHFKEPRFPSFTLHTRCG